MADRPADLIIAGPEDLANLGPYVRQRRYESGLGLANEAAPYLGVGVRLLTQLESGTRGKRGVTLNKLLEVLRGLGLELVVRPRVIAGHVDSSPVTTTQATGDVSPEPGCIREATRKPTPSRVTKKPVATAKRRRPPTR